MIVLTMVLCLFGVVAFASGAVVSADYSDPVIEWVRSKAGYINPKVSFQQDGVFAGENIAFGESVMTIPKDTLIVDQIGSRCSAARLLAKEYSMVTNGEQSEFGPYVQKLFESYPNAKPPFDWSKQGNELVRKMLGNGLVYTDLNRTTFADLCTPTDFDNKYDSGLLDTAISIVRSKSWAGAMIPVYDMLQHRNGEWHNVDFKTKLSGADVQIVAIEDIAVGEQLYFSYSDCADGNFCREDDYVITSTWHLFWERGFVEHYPRFWTFPSYEEHLEDFSFEEVWQWDEEVGAEAAKEVYSISWATAEPSLGQLNILQAYLDRLLDIDGLLHEVVDELNDEREARLATEFYEALTSALERAVIAVRDGPRKHAMGVFEQECAEAILQSKASDTGMNVSDLTLDDLTPEDVCDDHLPRHYDDLEYLDDNSLDIHFIPCDTYKHDHIDEKYISTVMDETLSHHQEVQFTHAHNERINKTDTCLHLGHLQSCTAFRAHYHEYLVHYAASYLDEVKRVLFLGGGDLMILHEILKYPTVELVIGMELDQQVIRSSFRNYGIQPHFDDDRVQWWFGDATKSLLMLPKELKGTFDLVLVDLEDFATDHLRVGGETSILEYAMSMLKPDGILSRNEDFNVRYTLGWAKYTLGLEISGLPHTCHQSITMGSNKVDFLTKTNPKNHNIETKVFNQSNNDPTANWGSYYRFDDISSREGARSNGTTSVVGTDQQEPDRYGVLIVIEAEEVALPLKDLSLITANIREALEKTGLKVIFVKTRADHDNDKQETYTTIFILHEGYVVARVWPGRKYSAFDVQLWKSFGKQQVVISELVASVGGDLLQTTSSYRIVTGGMGESPVEEESGSSTCKNEEQKGTTLEAPDSSTEKQEFTLDLVKTGPLDSFGKVMSEVIGLIVSEDPNPVLVILCADPTTPCKSLEVLSMASVSENILPLWACPSLLPVDNSTAISNESMLRCEREYRVSLMDYVSGNGKISGIVVDQDAPRKAGQIIHMILNTTIVRDELLEDKFVIVAPRSGEIKKSWREGLLERFRTKIIQIHPLFHAEAVFPNSYGNLELGIFSAGDDAFYSRLSRVLASMKEQNIAFDIRDVKCGLVKFIPDMQNPIMIYNEDYDVDLARKQFLGQQPLGQQSIFQFEIIPDLPITPQETVLVNTLVHNRFGRWHLGKVLTHNQDGTFNTMIDGKYLVRVKRNQIQKLQNSTEASGLSFENGDLVLVKFFEEDGDEYDDEFWTQGVVIQKEEDGQYKVLLFDYHASEIFVDPSLKDALFRWGEAPDVLDTDHFDSQKFKTVLQDAFSVENSSIYDYQEGGVFIFFLPGGGACVGTWDGQNHIDLNVFHTSPSTAETIREGILHSFSESLPSAKLVLYDEQPRGIGRVVNTAKELGLVWFGDIHFGGHLEASQIDAEDPRVTEDDLGQSEIVFDDLAKSTVQFSQETISLMH